MNRRALLLFACVAFLAAHSDAAQPAPAKKKRGEIEAEEEPAKLPQRQAPPSQQESYLVPIQLVGTWEAGGRRLTIQNGGAYTLSGAESDAGFVRANLGQVWRKSNRDRRWQQGRYNFRGIGEVAIEGVFGAGEWRRVK